MVSVRESNATTVDSAGTRNISAPQLIQIAFAARSTETAAYSRFGSRNFHGKNRQSATAHLTLKRAPDLVFQSEGSYRLLIKTAFADTPGDIVYSSY